MNKRALPWRKTRDPYFIWISEIILQQTRVDQGEPYYLKFIDRFPNIHSLANAREEDVLSLWQGLGYYTRARNMHKCARKIVNDYNGKFPESFSDLIKLPGIGPYTAAAIASISFKEPIAVLDGNVIRVLSRYLGITEIPKSTSGKKIFNEKAQENIYKEHPGDYNQAIMEFGALQCSPVNPDCLNCILKSSCYANRLNMQNSLPLKSPKKIIRNRYFHYLMISSGKKLMMRKRKDKDIWHGLYDFPLVESRNTRKIKFENFNDHVSNLLKHGEKIERVSDVLTHVLSHQKIHGRFYHMDIKNNRNLNLIVDNSDYCFYNALTINDLPKSIFITKYLNEVFY